MAPNPAEPLPRLVDCLRSRQLRYARAVLIMAGLFLFATSVVSFVRAEEIVRIHPLKNARMAKPEEVQRWVRNERIFQATQAAVGLTLILLGSTLYRVPLFCLVTAAVVYTLHLVIAVTIDPLSLNFRLYQVSILSAAMLGAIRAAKGFRRSSKSASGDTQAHENRQPSEMPQLHHIPALVQQSLEQPLLIEVYAPAPLQRSALVWCLIALGMAGVAVFTGHSVFAWLASLPALLSMALAITRPGPLHAVFDDTALEVLQPKPMTIPWAKIVAISTRGKRPRDPFAPSRSNYRINVVHWEGSFEIPRNTDRPSDEILRLLLHRIPTHGRDDLPPALIPYWQEQLRRFGSQYVCSYRSEGPRTLSWHRRKKFFMLGLVGLGTAAIWFFSGDPVLIALGVAAIVFGLISLLGSLPVPLWSGRLKNAALVISPRGFALCQGALVGYADWQEVTMIRWGYDVADPESFRPAIAVIIADQKIPIYDIYDRPLMTIYRQMHYYWRGVELQAG
jgi:hypothetical protein